MRTSPRALTAAVALLAGATVALSSGPVSVAASPSKAPTQVAKLQGDHRDVKVKDNRHGRVSPTTQQRAEAAAVGALAAWNALGTPAMLTSTGEPLASGLPADPVAAAEAYVDANRDVLGLTARGANALELITSAPMGDGAAVLFRQRFGGLVAGVDGMLTVGVRDGAVWHVSSSLARDAAKPAPATISPTEAAEIAKADTGAADAQVASTRLVAVPTADRGARAAYEVIVTAGLDGAEPVAYTTFVDARDRSVLLRENLVDSDVDNPEWTVFANTPPTDYSSTDTRVRWCSEPAAGCDEVIGSPASPLAWDVKSTNRKPTETTDGNNAFAVHNWFTNDPFKVGHELATSSPIRDYAYAWTNQWQREKCSPVVFETAARNDIDAARANLFAMHNRMHDWAYHLGFTEATFNLQNDNFNGRINHRKCQLC